MEALLLIVVRYLYSYGDILPLWSLGMLFILGVSRLCGMLLILIGYGRLILVSFIIVTPNRVKTGCFVSLLGVFFTTICGNLSLVTI
jgi:hypothetical protein